MTPKEKALSIMSNLYHSAMSTEGWRLYYKRCAIYLVDQIIEHRPLEPNDVKHADTLSDYTDAAEEYWNQVKKEIELL